MRAADPRQKQLLIKGAAGLVLGFAIALGLSGLLVFALPVSKEIYARDEVAMWAVVPPWLLILSLSFLFKGPGRAWAWLGFACITVHALLAAFRHAV